MLDADAGPCRVYRRAVDEGLGKAGKGKRSTSMASKDGQVWFLSINDTAKLISHQRLLYHSFAKLLDEVPGKCWQGCSNDKLQLVIEQSPFAVHGATCSHAPARGHALLSAEGCVFNGQTESNQVSEPGPYPQPLRLKGFPQIVLDECFSPSS